MGMRKLWEGRIEGERDSAIERFNASIDFDKRLYKEDIEGSVAHAKMLQRIGLFTEDECERVVKGLRAVEADIENGKMEFTPALEDIHTHIENALRAKIGDAAGKLHTARSRNDQVNVDVRLYLKRATDEILCALTSLETVILEMAKENINTIMPGYTHLQPAQPMRLSHLLLAYFFMLARDIDRLKDAKKRADTLTLGSGAFAGLNYPVDREYVRETLGFARISENALDAVSDRDFIVEFLSAIAILFTHLSRIAEDFIIFNSNEYRFVELADAYTTGSSIMPNKKNPDMFELTRGKTGRVYGNLVTALTIMKALPSAYNKDLQEDKPPLFDSIDAARMTIPIVEGALKTAVFDTRRMLEACEEGFITAVEIADYLAAKNVPFRDAHTIVARIVKKAHDEKKTFKDLTLDDYRAFSALFDEDVYRVVEVEYALKKKVSEGSTGEESVREQIAKAEKTRALF